MKLSEMKRILAEHGIQLTKSLGQNFLHDGNQLRRIVASAELKKTDQVLEVGPGLGPLTALLVERVGKVVAIEKDARLVRLLEQRFDLEREGGGTVLALIHDDALDYLKRKHRDWQHWKLVANLPYSIASPLLVELALRQTPPERIVVTLQLEVARRLVADPGQKDYGVLTLLVQLQYQPLGWFKIPASCFFPEPDVDSACVSLARREPLLEPDLRDTFIQIVKLGFSQRRKMMFKLLKEAWPAAELELAFGDVGLAAAIRAEAVTLEQFARLARCLHRRPTTIQD
jgi:16S rRNA (adenine1518-N6/adenine1519-N6)-dimethyltransferase